MSIAQWMQVAVVVIGLVAALLFYLGSIGVPHEQQSWDGVTPRKRRQKLANWTAIELTTIAVALRERQSLLPVQTRTLAILEETSASFSDLRLTRPRGGGSRPS